MLQLDDPLAGLDAVTKQKVFAEAIGPGSLSADAGRILVTQACMLMHLVDDRCALLMMAAKPLLC
jgi:hypothetical protein